MFKDALKDLVEGVDGGIASTVMDSSGIAVDTYARSDAAFDISTIGIEYGVVLGSIKRAAEQLGAGNAQEVVIETEKHSTVLRVVNDTYFIALAVKPGASLGKARFRIRIVLPTLVAELS